MFILVLRLGFKGPWDLVPALMRGSQWVVGTQQGPPSDHSRLDMCAKGAAAAQLWGL